VLFCSVWMFRIGRFCSILEGALELQDVLEEFLIAISQFGYCSSFVIWAAVAVFFFFGLVLELLSMRVFCHRSLD